MPRGGGKSTAARAKADSSAESASGADKLDHGRAEALIKALKRLPLEDVSAEEVQEMQRGEMEDAGSLPTAAKIVADAADEILDPILKESVRLASKENVENNDTEAAILTTVAAADVDLKKVATLLLQLALHGGSNAFTAGTTYLALISLPGSAIYSMINTSATGAVFQLLKSWIVTRAAESGKKAKESNKKADTKKTNDEDDDMDVDGEAATGAAATETSETIQAMLSISPSRALQMAEMLVKLCKNTPLEMHPETLSLAVETATLLTRFRVSGVTAAKKKGKRRGDEDDDDEEGGQVSLDDAQKMRGLGYRALVCLVDSKHGPLDASTTLVFRTVLANILGAFPMMFLPATSNSSSGRDFTDIRNGAIDVVLQLLDAFSASEATGAHIVDASISLLQHLCMRVPDKAELRHGASHAVVTILLSLRPQAVHRFVSFVDKFARNQKPAFRMFAVELAEKLLTSKNVSGDSEMKLISADGISTLVTLVVQRCADKSVTVRANAVGAIASILEGLLQVDAESKFRSSISRVLFTQQPIAQVEGEAAGAMSPPAPKKAAEPATNGFLTMVRRRISDEKANVRKAALQVLEMIGRSRFEGVSLTADDVAILQERCFDPQVAIRKQALISLSELFKSQPNNAILRQSWVSTVPSLTYDTEQSVQDKVMSYIEELMFDAAVKGCESPDAPVWKILEDIDRGAIDASKNLQRICQQLARDNKISKPVFKSLMKALEKHQIKGAWILLAHVAPFWPQLVDADFVVSAWESVRDKKANDSDEMKVKVLRVLVHVASQLKGPVATKLTQDLVSRLEHFNTRPTVIQVAIQVAAALQITLGNKSDDWMRTLLQKCDASLSASVLGSSDSNGNEIDSLDKLDAYLFTLGELAQRCKKETMPRRAVNVVQTLIAPTFEGLRIKDHGKDDLVRPSASSRAQAFVTLGKMCLQDQALAKSCIPAFARELEMSSDSIVRNNVMVVLCDLTIRYTNLVDNYVGKIAVCLRDDSELVRRQTLMLLTNLMKEDYIKLRSGPLFFRLILLLVDDSASLRQFAGVCLDAITNRASADKNLFYNHFVESIFYLNDYRMHTAYNKFSQTDRERALFSLRGSGINQLKRMEIYKSMLSRMSDDQKFQVASQMCREILNAVTENQLLVNEQTGFYVLQDALLILCSKDIKIKITGIGSGGDELEDISEGSQKLIEAKGKILSKLMKKNIVENIVPIVIELKHLLAKQRSPLLGNLMDYLREIMKDYKDEIQDIFVSDRQLAQELEYEFRMVNASSARERQALAQQQQQQQQQAAASNNAQQEAAGAPSPAPRLKASVPSVYNPSPAKVRKPAAESSSGSPEDGALPVPQVDNGRRASVLLSPTLARMRAANINFMSPSKLKAVARSGDDEDIPVEPARLDLSAAGPVEPKTKGKGKKAAAPKAKATSKAKKAAAPKRKRKAAESDDEDDDAAFSGGSDNEQDDVPGNTDENTSPVPAKAKSASNRPARGGAKRTKRE